MALDNFYEYVSKFESTLAYFRSDKIVEIIESRDGLKILWSGFETEIFIN